MAHTHAGRIRKQKLAKYLGIWCTRGSVSSQILQMYYVVHLVVPCRCIMQWFNGICFSLPENICFSVQACDLNLCVLQWCTSFLTAGSPSEHVHSTWPCPSLFKTQLSNIQQTNTRSFRGHPASKCIQHVFKWTFRRKLQTQDLLFPPNPKENGHSTLGLMRFWLHTVLHVF